MNDDIWTCGMSGPQMGGSHGTLGQELSWPRTTGMGRASALAVDQFLPFLGKVDGK